MTHRVRTVALRSLRDVSNDGLCNDLTPVERLALVEVLTQESWSLAGMQVTSTPRGQQPVVIRPLRSQGVVGE